MLERVGAVAASLLPGEDAVALNRRQAAHIERGGRRLERGGGAPAMSCWSRKICAAPAAAFDRLTGRAGVEDVLDALFGRFCLGK